MRLERERTAEQAHTVENKAKQDFFDAAADQMLWKSREFDDGKLSRTFSKRPVCGAAGVG